MMRKMTIADFVASAVGAAIALSAAMAQHHESEPAAVVAGAYAPRLGDLMILQQIRHSKLWFAVAAYNWELAEHSLYEIKEGFADVARLYPTVQEVAVAPVIGALNEREIAELARAIEARDRVKFTIAFDQLTAACNACHQVTQHAFIVIQQPISPPFNNQSFPPPGGQSPPPGSGQSHPH
jgi:hypothetical protein